MPSLVELKEEHLAKAEALVAVTREAGPDLDFEQVTSLSGSVEEKVAEWRRRNAELNVLGERVEKLEDIERQHKANERELARRVTPLPFGGPPGAGHGAAGPAVSPLRQAMLESSTLKLFREGRTGSCALDLPHLDWKTLVTLTTISPQTERRGEIVPMALEERTVADLMMQGTASGNKVEYYAETTFTNTAAPVAEGATKPSMTVGFTLVEDPIRKIAVTIDATKEALDDNAFLESQLRNRLAYAVRRVEEEQLLNGDGTGQEILGLLNRVGIQTTAVAGGEALDAIFVAMQNVRGANGSGFAEPTGAVFHPANWTKLKLTTTADGIYLFGGPADEGPDRVWGISVRQTTGMPLGTGLVGAFRPFSEVLRREGITIIMSTEHGTYAIENKVLLIAESRLGLACYRPSAFSTITGLTTYP